MAVHVERNTDGSLKSLRVTNEDPAALNKLAKVVGIQGNAASNQPEHRPSDDATPREGYGAQGSNGQDKITSPNILGVDLNTLADLPQDLRARAIQALEALADARRLNNAQAESTAAATLAEIIGEIETAHGVAKVFDASLKKAEKPDNVAAAHWFGRRQGVIDDDLPPQAA